ncbi:MAG: hypothetical protein ACAI43_14945 [Phycisphaerae bacterium]|nr:hypothetical protein [Tepidisphaeraceae bacterium]
MKGRTLLAALALAASPAAFADITGSAVFEGKAPAPKILKVEVVPDCAKHAPVKEETIVVNDKNELKNVVVYIDGQNLGGEKRTDTVVLDQKGCVYTPHVVAVQVGQKFEVKNSDPFMHNVHGLSKDSGEFNFPQNKDGVNDVTNKANKAPERYVTKCDVHPWMKAWIVVLDHPFFAVSGDDGKFTIPTKGLKDGEYTLNAWQEKLGTQTAKITVKDGKAQDVKFTFKPKAAAAEPVEKETFVSIPTAPGERPCCGACKDGEKKPVAVAPAAN